MPRSGGNSPRDESYSPLRSATTMAADTSVTASETSDGSVIETILKSERRNPVKQPWDPWLTKMGDLKGNSEVCACGSVYIGDDLFCYRCGCRRPVDIDQLPMHVGRMPEPPIEDVGERMIAWSEAYTQRREALTALKKENEEYAEKTAHAGVPFINPLSSDLTSDLKPISQRYKGLVWMKEFTLQRKRALLGEEKAEAYVLNPKINNRSKSLERGVEDLLKFRVKSQKKIDYKRQQKLQMQQAECTFQPILGTCNRRFAIAHQHKVHDRLYSDASQRKFNLKSEQDHYEADWKLANARDARSRSPKPPDVGAPKKKLPAPPEKLKHLMRSISADPKMSSVKFAGGTRTRSPPGSPSPSSRVGEGEDCQTPRTPSRVRGPRASAAVLPTKEEISMSNKKTRKRKPKGKGSPTRQSQLGADDKSNASRASSLDECGDEDEADYQRIRQWATHKSVWTGGHNVVKATNKYKSLLEKCQPDLGEDPSQPPRGKARSNSKMPSMTR